METPNEADFSSCTTYTTEIKGASAKYPPGSCVLSFRVSENHLRFCVCPSEKQWEYASFLATALLQESRTFSMKYEAESILIRINLAWKAEVTADKGN